MPEQLLNQLDGAVGAAERYGEAVRSGLAARLSSSGRLDPAQLEADRILLARFAPAR